MSITENLNTKWTNWEAVCLLFHRKHYSVDCYDGKCCVLVYKVMGRKVYITGEYFI